MIVLTAAVLLALAGAAVTLGLVLVRRAFMIIEVEGRSMEPTLRSGDRLLVRRSPAAVRSLRRDEIVVIARIGPGDGFLLNGGPQRVVKRVVAVAGDPVPPVFQALGEERVPPGHVLVLGDNPDFSADSRQWGFLPVHRVTGVVARRLSPAARRASGESLV